MRISALARNAIGTCVSTLLLAACNNSSNTIPSSPVKPTSPEKVIHSFGTGSDGTYPRAGLIDVGGTLYGTTSGGGAYVSLGTVYSITTSGTEAVLSSFADQDGAFPVAELISVNGIFYGTTGNGGRNGTGSVFSVSPAGAISSLYSFIGPYGSSPVAGLLNVNGTFYGTTKEGGEHNSGTVFAITPGGKYKLIYSFGSTFHDGRYPEGGLIDVGGTLYGTTFNGGAGDFGTVFSITPSGNEKVIHSFGSGNGGTFPAAGLLNVGGTLYGTTTKGGGTNTAKAGAKPNFSNVGTVFAITPNGTETTVYSFAGGDDGAHPSAGLIDVDGTLYGTTNEGGTSNKGTVFGVTLSGSETVLHSFAGGSDGATPAGLLLDVAGTLYGTTEFGGSNARGTVFSLNI